MYTKNVVATQTISQFDVLDAAKMSNVVGGYQLGYNAYLLYGGGGGPFPKTGIWTGLEDAVALLAEQYRKR